MNLNNLSKQIPMGASLFNNPMIENLKKTMKKEDLENYEKIGQHMYGSIDFESGKANEPFMMTDALANLIGMIKSGLHPSMLTDDEKFFLKEMKGDEWYKSLGFVKEDLDEIVTLKFK